MIRVLHIVPDLTWNGGIATWLLNTVAPCLPEQAEHTVCFVGRDDGYSRMPDLRERGIRVVEIPFRPALIPAISFMCQLSRFLRTNRFDIIHSHRDWLGGLDAFIAARHKVPVRILYFHSGRWQHAKSFLRTIEAHFLRRIGTRNATHFWSNSWGSLENWFGAGCRSGGRFAVIRGGIRLLDGAPPDRMECRKRLDIPPGCFAIGHVGRFTRPKNHVTMLKVFSIVKKKVPEAELLFFGDGILRNDVERLAAGLCKDGGVRFMGVRKDIVSCLAALNVFFFPSLYESLGLAVLEAQDAGLPIVYSDIPGLRDAVAPRWSRFCAHPMDYERFAELLLSARNEKPCRPDSFLVQFSDAQSSARLLDAYRWALESVIHA